MCCPRIPWGWDGACGPWREPKLASLTDPPAAHIWELALCHPSLLTELG